MFEVPTLLVLVPGLCLAATLLTALLGPRALRERSHWPPVIGIGLALVVSIALLARVAWESRSEPSSRIGYERIVPLWTWAAVPHACDRSPLTLTLSPKDLPPLSPLAEEASGGGKSLGEREPATSPSGQPLIPVNDGSFRVEVVLRADPLTATMLVVVTLVAFLVAVYSIGYMDGDPGYWRFFTYISLFVFSMTMLVSVSNFVMLYVFWEAVGLCSYLLIGFWYQKPEAAAAGKKAFLVNRVGDFGFALGVFLIWTTFGTLNFHDTANDMLRVQPGVLGQWGMHHPADWFPPGATITAICLLLMLGACGKSAQVPLHVWLPDAMEGPTPVSALIHAATMVTAGVYMVARCAPLYAASAPAMEVVAGIGAVTALVAAIIAVTQTDLKRILAYSTISQLGYMFLGLGALAVTAGMFHLVTHAFFKGLLFLGAGSVMHAMGGVIDIRRFGGLRNLLPTTHWTFLVGCLALAGFPFLSGFFSKDEILAAVHDQGLHGASAPFYYVLYWVALFTAFLTAFYTFRAYFLAFHGDQRLPHEAGDHAHESPRVMTVPLVVLAVFSAAAGAVLWWTDALTAFLERTPSIAYLATRAELPEAEGSHSTIAVIGGLVGLAGIALAWTLYLGRRQYLPRFTRVMETIGAYKFSFNKFFFDPTYNMLFVWPAEAIARFSAWVDRNVIDGLVDATGRVPARLGAMFRRFQIGLVPFYGLVMLVGMLVLLGALLL